MRTEDKLRRLGFRFWKGYYIRGFTWVKVDSQQMLVFNPFYIGRVREERLLVFLFTDLILAMSMGIFLGVFAGRLYKQF
jgi:hypothetical protein